MPAAQLSVVPIQDLPRKTYPVKILQFGAGNFLRGFADWMVQMANDKVGFNAGIAVVQSMSNSQQLTLQKGVYTLLIKGIKEEEFVSERYKIDTIQRVVNPASDFSSYLEEALNPDLQFVFSNTTEVGIVFSGEDKNRDVVASTFPGKLTQLLYKRFQNSIHTNIIVLPTELIEHNGEVLKKCVQQYVQLWALPLAFTDWLNKHITFCTTLVDRIVPGNPKRPREVLDTELGYSDGLAVEGEWFHLWVIEGPYWLNEVLPFAKAGLNVILTNDLAPYRIRKVRILNGSHTCMAPIGYLAGIQTVRETIEHPIIGRYIKRLIFDDIVPNIPGDLVELEKYAEEVIARFRNPAIDHQLESIISNSFSKFKIRVLPSLLTHINKSGLVPDRLSYSLAALIFLYRGLKGGKDIPLKDTEDVIATMKKIWAEGNYSKSGMEEICKKILCKKEWWGQDLTEIHHLVEHTGNHLYSIDQFGVVESLKKMEEETFNNKKKW
jgi:tagaturonate reductase